MNGPGRAAPAGGGGGHVHVPYFRTQADEEGHATGHMGGQQHPADTANLIGSSSDHLPRAFASMG